MMRLGNPPPEQDFLSRVYLPAITYLPSVKDSAVGDLFDVV